MQPEEDYQISSNFVAYDELNIGEGFTESERYDAVQARIEQGDGMLPKMMRQRCWLRSVPATVTRISCSGLSYTP